MSGSLRGRRAEEKTQSNISFPRGSENPVEEVMAIEVPQNEEVSEGGKNGGRKGVGFCHPSEKSG